MSDFANKRPTIKIPIGRKLLYSLVVVLGFFGFLEVSLRLLDLGRPPIVGQLRFGYETGIPIYDSDGIEKEGDVFVDAPLFEQDSVLFWRPIANSPFTGPRGFRKPEPSDPQTSNEPLTIAVLGDSCSFLGLQPYPEILSKLLMPSDPNSVRVFNASCPGYSIQQGVLQLDKIDRLHPDIVIVYFGWNDHWNSLNGCSDRELIKRTQFARQTQSVLGNYNTYRFASSLMKGRTIKSHKSESNSMTVRVPLSDYEANLRLMAERFKQWNCKAVFITAPSGFVQGQLPVWAEQFFGQFYQMTPQQVADIPQTHQGYNNMTRNVASQLEDCTVCDLEKVFEHQRNLFRSDCIHLSELGHQQAAALIAESIRQLRPSALNATAH